MTSEMLALRRARKSRKPTFKIQDSNKKPQLSSWRKPRGLHNKVRLHKKGHEVCPSVGYRSPRAVRGLDRSGLAVVLVHTLSQLEGLDAKTQGVVIASAVGARSRLALYAACQKQGLTVLSVTDLAVAITVLEEKFSSRKKFKAEKLAAKKKAAEKKAKAAKEKEATPADKKETPAKEAKEVKTPVKETKVAEKQAKAVKETKEVKTPVKETKVAEKKETPAKKETKEAGK